MLISYRKILVALDGSGFAAQAIPHAYSLAKQLGAELVLFRVVGASGSSSAQQNASQDKEVRAATSGSEDEDSAEAALATLHDHIIQLDDTEVTITPVIEEGLPENRICAYARDNNVDLIVMTSHGRTGLQRLVHGSVTESVLRQTPCPTLVLRSS